MIRQEDVIRFFDAQAPNWDADMIRDDRIIGSILDRADVRAGMTVLDVGTGTGVLIPDYLARGVRHVTGIDISPEMIRIARQKFGGNDRVTLVLGDVEQFSPGALFDVVMVYNAFPHFPDPARLIRVLSSFVKPGGRLSIAHGMSREAIDAHHLGPARLVSNGLMSAEALKRLFEPWLTVETVISNDEMYQVVGRK